MSLRIIAAGGTFDKHYDEIAGRLGYAESHLPEAIARARITAPLVLEQLTLCDSLDMQDKDRHRILVSCEAAPEERIIIVHGTDTMRETGQVLGAARLRKTLILTGAMVPYELMHSDALFNFGFACCAAQALPYGVYIAMNGQVFQWDAVRKNRARGVFESL